MINFLKSYLRSNHSAVIYNRQGVQVSVVSLPGQCTSLDWDKDGEFLSITQDFNGMSNIVYTSCTTTSVMLPNYVHIDSLVFQNSDSLSLCNIGLLDASFVFLCQ